MTLNVPKRAQGPSPAHNRSKLQEAELARKIGGKVTPGSGSGHQAGDVRKRGLARVECKTTKNKSFSVSIDLLDKLDAAVLGTGELPFFEIELELGRRRAIVMTGDALDLIMEALRAAD